MKKSSTKLRVATLRELDALVAENITGETPEVYWEDAHAVFRFESEHEAVETLKRMKPQLNLPAIDWQSMAVTKVKLFRPYSSEMPAAWLVIERISSSIHQLQIRRDKGMWHVSFGDCDEAVARSAPVAICLAGLITIGVEVDLDRDRIH